MMTDSIASTALADHNRQNRIFGKFGGYISLQSGPRIVAARNKVIDLFLSTEDYDFAKWIVFIDADMNWNGDQLLDMLEKADELERPIVGGLCFGGRVGNHMFPTAYVVTGTHDNGLPIVETQLLDDPDFIEAIDSDEPPMIQVDATGAAFLAVRRDILLEMHREFSTTPSGATNPNPWFAELTGDGVDYGEDIGFCLRARQLRIPIWIDTRMKVGHVKTNNLTWDGYKEQLARQG